MSLLRLFIIILLTGFLLSCNDSKNTTINESSINYDSLRVVLEHMRFEDQEIRRIIIDSIGLSAPNVGPYLKRMSEIDAANQEKIRLILKEYGWIPISKVGEKAADAIFYTIQHSDRELMEKYFPEFKRLADQGEASRKQCAMMEDRLLMWNGKKQIYGTQASDFREDKTMAIWPIDDPKHVNQRRKEVGFTTTIEEYAKRLNAIYNPDEQLPSEQ